MQLSVIILNYNVRYFLEQCVISVQKALESIDGEIIVVDNHSMDDSCEMIRNNFPNVKLISNNQNLGFPKGNNLGVSMAKGEYICILNPDTVVAEDTFTKVLEFAKAQKNLGIVGCKLIDGRGNFLPESKRGVPTPWVAFTKIANLYKIFPNTSLFTKYYAQHISAYQTGAVDVLVGAFMIMKRELYLQVGGFDEACFMYSDDIDLSYSVKKLGLENYYFADTAIIHYKGESTVKDQNYMNRFREAMQFFYNKHFRRSFFFEYMMRMGAFVFVLFKAKTKSEKIYPKKYLVLSENLSLQQRLADIFKKNTILVTEISEKKLNSQLIKTNEQTEVVFDGDVLSFKSIIHLMQKAADPKITYKIKPANTSFIIGSNSSEERGEVLVLD